MQIGCYAPFAPDCLPFEFTAALDEGRVIKLPATRRRGNTSQPPGSSCDRSGFDPALVASRAASQNGSGGDSGRKVSVGKEGKEGRKEALANLHIRGERRLTEGDRRLRAHPQARAGLGSPSDTS